MQADTLFTHGTIATMTPARRVIDNGWITVKDGIISALGPMTTPPPTATRSLDCSGQILIPGLIDAHAQAGHALIRSMRLHSGNRWEDICGVVYIQASSPEFWSAESRLATLERLRFGVTTGVSLLGGGDTIMRSDDPDYAAAHCAGVAEVGTRSVVAIGPTRAPHPRISADWQGAPLPSGSQPTLLCRQFSGASPIRNV